MRTTITLPDPLFDLVKELAGDISFGEFVRRAVEDRVEQMRRGLLQDMAEGYRAEAMAPSLDPAWLRIETDLGWAPGD